MNEERLQGTNQLLDDLKEAQSLEQRDIERADEVYRRAISADSQAPIQKREVYQKYGEFLQRNWRFKDAQALYRQAIESMRAAENANWEAYFLERGAAVEHDLYIQGELEKPDAELIKRAVQLRPESEGQPTPFGAIENLTYGRVLSDCGDFYNATKRLERAMQQFRRLNDPGRVLESTNAVIACLVQHDKFKDANKYLLQAIKNAPTSKWDLQNNFLDICRRKQLRSSGIVPKIRKLVNEANFNQLEDIADHYRKSAQTLASGRWFIDAFYADIDNLMSSQSEKDWQDRIALIKRWEQEKPNSPTPKIALGLVLKSYAWKAQGSGLIRPESESAKLMQERLQQARSYLDQVQDKPPEWYGVTSFVAIGQHWPHDEFERMVSECRQKYPKYDTVLLNKAYWLQPNWYGKEGDAEAFIESEAKKRSSEDGNILYARAAWWLDRILGGVFSRTKFTWPKAKEGMLALRQKYPYDPTVRSELCVLATQAGDARTAETAFDK